ncbi:hypothetical protein [Stenotrophomonas phage StenR_269]|nr:hypothetical protein [Stenotrophomonas phage StenR_269]
MRSDKYNNLPQEAVAKITRLLTNYVQPNELNGYLQAFDIILELAKPAPKEVEKESK